MKQFIPIRWLLLSACLVLLVVAVFLVNNKAGLHLDKNTTYHQAPNNWFFMQRAYPFETINYNAFDEALEQADRLLALNVFKQNGSWEFIGPTNVGGRLTDVVMHPSDSQTVYAASASGGVFKSTDLGDSWQAIFDDQPSLSIGALAIDPEDPDVIYVGTGEVNGGGGSLTYGGTGVYKSEDAGQSWASLGLSETRHIGRIVIDPSNTQRIFVAAMGRLFSENEERGLYRSEDGGKTWENVLYISPQTGSIDVVINPSNPDTMYTAMWQRIRYPDSRMFGGDEGGVFRSIDGGTTWTELTSGLPETEIGRIGLGLAPSEPNVLYALYADEVGPFRGFYKSTDGGDNWTQLPDNPVLVQNSAFFGWWFGNVHVHPENPDIIYSLGLRLVRSEDGGVTFEDVSDGMHVDHHGLYIHPANTNLIIDGNDGGFYVSRDGGNAWEHKDNLPITQFYTVDIDFQNPLHVAGGTQDNNTYQTYSSSPPDWEVLVPIGDGQYVRFDPSDDQKVYGSFQRGAIMRSVDGGENFFFATQGIDAEEPVNWSAPIELDLSNPGTLYTGTNRIYRSENEAQSWAPISPILPGRSVSTSVFDTFGTITSIAVSPTNPDYIYVGTDDGLVWVSTNRGEEWNEITQSLPQRWVTRVMVDPFLETNAYVTYSGFREDVPLPHVFKTTDTGESWTDITSNLPEAPVNDIIPDPVQPGLLYVATDVGVFYTVDNGEVWMPLGEGVPRVPVTDLSLHAPSRKLVAATYGRSMYSFDLAQIGFGPTGVESIVDSPAERIDVLENYPNPFVSSTTVRFSLQAASDVLVELYDLTNRRVAILQDAYLSAGVHEIAWEGQDMSGREVAAGRYFCRVQAGEQVKMHQLVRVR